MQAVIRSFFFLVVLTFALPGFAAAQDAPRPRPLQWGLEAAQRGDWQAAARIAARDGEVARDVILWHQLRNGAGTYSQMQDLLSRHPNWPGLKLLRRRSEHTVLGQNVAAARDFFAAYPAQTPQGALAHGVVLMRAGKEKDAQEVIRNAWLSMGMSAQDQALFRSSFAQIVNPLNGARLDAMLWRKRISDAERIMPMATETEQAIALARIALQKDQDGVDALIAAVPAAQQTHPGLQHDRFEWRLRKGRWGDAKMLLLEQSTSAEALGRPEAWANRRRSLARDEMRDASARRAYQLASQHFLSSGSHYADLEWLSGYIALRYLKDPKRALGHFQNHGGAVRSPISQARAGYWIGRAHAALGNRSEAKKSYAQAAQFQTAFYGLLAAEAADLPFDVGLKDVPQEDWRNRPFVQDSRFIAGELLVASGYRSLGERFFVQLAEGLSDRDAALLGQALIERDEPHLAVMVGKAKARQGRVIPVPYYALHSLTTLDLPVPSELALAIARRESEFDPNVVSGAGARGLMQLMPGTGKEVAGNLGLSEEHSDARLTDDPLYNARLGSTYLAELTERFGGNIVMMSAAYNAGPSRPERWMKLYGDPRGKSVETMIDWIETIPFRETRNYVMRVTESLPIYRARLGKTPLPVPFGQELAGR